MGPVVNRVQWEKIQGLIEKGINEGATLVTGGVGRPEGLNKGYYVRPTVFADVRNDMSIAREEIFGPVLSIIGYKDEDDAVRLANETPIEAGRWGYSRPGFAAAGRVLNQEIRYDGVGATVEAVAEGAGGRCRAERKEHLIEHPSTRHAGRKIEDAAP